jgi:pilus assembly protein CpaB
MPRFNRNFIFLGVAIVLGVLASFLAVRYVNKQVANRTQAPAEHTVKVVVPVRDLPKGAILQQSDIAARDVPADFVPGNAITPADYNAYLGQILRAPLTHGAPIPASAMENLADHFSSVIRPGDVAYTIQVNASNSVSGMIAPGDRVDILLLTGRDEQVRSQPLLNNVLVVATGQRAQGVSASDAENTHSYSNMTLELSPRDAQRVGIARKVGDLGVLLRNAGNVEPFGLKALTGRDVLGMSRRAHHRGVIFIIGGKG